MKFFQGIRKTENLLKNRLLTDEIVLVYFIILLALEVIVNSTSSNDYFEKSMIYFENALSFLGTGIGVIVAFYVNKKGDGIDFFKRYIALNFIIGVKFIFYSILIMFLIIILMEITNINWDEPSLLSDYIIISVETLVIIAFNFLLITSFKRIARIKEV